MLNIPSYDESDMPIGGASGVSADCQAHIPDSMTMGRYLELQEQAARKKVSKDFDALLDDVKGGKYSSVKRFAAAVGKPAGWATDFRRVVVSQNLLTPEGWRACFKRGGHGNG